MQNFMLNKKNINLELNLSYFCIFELGFEVNFYVI